MPNPAENARILHQLRKLRIDTPRDSAFISRLDRLLCRDEEGNLQHEPQRFSLGQETRGVMVIDGAGGGKTTLIARALERHPVLTGPDGRHYLEASVPSPATFKSVGGTLLERSGYPVITANREGWSLWETLRGRLKNLGITVLWIDEAHDLFCADKNLILRALKALMQGDEAVIPILSGTERLHEIVRSDPQVRRRFNTLILPPVAEAVDGASFQGVIGEYCRIAGLEPPTGGRPDPAPVPWGALSLRSLRRDDHRRDRVCAGRWGAPARHRPFRGILGHAGRMPAWRQRLSRPGLAAN